MQLCGSLSILWHCLSLGLEWKLTFSSPVATAESSKFAGILSAALSQHTVLKLIQISATLQFQSHSHILGFHNSCKYLTVYSCVINYPQTQWLKTMCVFVCVCVCTRSVVLTLYDPMDGSPPGPSVHGISQARIQEWIAISFSRGSSSPRDQTLSSYVSCTGNWILYHCTTWEAQKIINVY